MTEVFWVRNVAASIVGIICWLALGWSAPVDPRTLVAIFAGIYLILIAGSAVEEREVNTITIVMVITAFITVALVHWIGPVPLITLAAVIYGWSNADAVYDPRPGFWRSFTAVPCGTAFILASYTETKWMLLAAALMAILQASVLYILRTRPAVS